jgi:cysteinyl-tRNA synthetase
MAREHLGDTIDIHAGGQDLTFPHHENEIAQSTAGRDDTTYASMFVHNEHILVDGKKMSKSLNNFYTLADLTAQGIDPLAFRLLVLQSHYRRATNFSFDNAQAAKNRLHHWRTIAALRHQTHDTLRDDSEKSTDEQSLSLLVFSQAIIEALNNDLNTPIALMIVDDAFSRLDGKDLGDIHQFGLTELLTTIDDTLGLQLIASTPDISDSAKQLILQREQARGDKNWQASDELRDQLLEQGIVVRDTAHGTIWEYA